MKVCHVKVGDFLAPSETFIYRRVCDPELHHHVLALKRTNTHKYPLPENVGMSVLSESPTVERWMNWRWLNRTGRCPWYSRNILKLSPDVVHAHFGAAGWAALPACEKNEIPLIVTLYGSDFHTVYKQDPVWKERTDILFRKARYITAISDFMIGALEKAGCDRTKLLRIRCGIDLSELRFYEKRLDNGEPLRILSVARLHPIKRLEDLLKACNILKGQDVQFELRLIGDGPLRDELRQRALDLGLNGQVRFLLDTARPETVRNLEWCHVLVLPSAMESQGIVLQEAQATGSAVIGTDTGAIRESLLHEKSGFLVPVNNPASIASSLVRFAKEPDLIARMGQEGRRFVEDRFDVKTEWADLRQLYHAALKK